MGGETSASVFESHVSILLASVRPYTYGRFQDSGFRVYGYGWSRMCARIGVGWTQSPFLLGHHGVCERLSVDHVAELLDLRFYKDVAAVLHVRSCAAERRVEGHLRDVVVAGNGGNMRYHGMDVCVCVCAKGSLVSTMMCNRSSEGQRYALRVTTPTIQRHTTPHKANMKLFEMNPPSPLFLPFIVQSFL